MRRMILLLPILSLAACTEGVTMRNPATGITAMCGPKTEALCIENLKAQGYERVARDWNPWSAR